MRQGGIINIKTEQWGGEALELCLKMYEVFQLSYCLLQKSRKQLASIWDGEKVVVVGQSPGDITLSLLKGF